LQNDAEYCSDTKTWSWDGVNFEFIYPPENKDNLTSTNENSCVLRVDTGSNGSILLTGDIEKKAEKWLVENKNSRLPASILVAPHHGSVTSSSDDFISAVHPKYVLFATGYLNRFHFPAKTIVARYLKNNSTIFNTATEGAIIFKLNITKQETNPILYRISNKHYWNE